MTINIHTFRTPVRGFGIGRIHDDYPVNPRISGFYIRVSRHELWVEWDKTP